MNKTAAMNNHETTAGEYIAYGIGSIILLGGSYFTVKHFIKKAKENNQQNQSFKEGAASTYAKGIKMAL